MRRLPNTLLVIGFMLALLLAGCSGHTVKDASGGKEPLTLAPGEKLAASFTDSRLPAMKGVLQNEQLQLLVDDTGGAIAVVQKKTGEIWFSNPPDREQDSLAAGVNKDLLSSQLSIDYFNAYGQLNSMNSYSDSVAHKQISFERMPQGVRVNYQLGVVQKTAEDLPLKLRKERLEELSGKLNSTGKRALLIAYKEDKENGIYTRNDTALVGLQLERAFQAFADAGYTDADLQADMRDLDFEQTKAAPRVFLASLEYTLDGNSLVARVPAASLHYPKEYPLNQLSVLSYFGAAGKETAGAIFVPDGSGALIRFNNGKAAYPPYQQTVYGTDRTMDLSDKPLMEQPVRLPVFGMIKESGAFLGIIESGAPVAAVKADVSGRLNSYNYAHPIFNVINKGEVTLLAGSIQRSLPKFQEEPMKTDYTVRYAFLSGEAASYTGMAHYYRDYLLERKKLPPTTPLAQSDNTPFILQLVGGIDKTKHFAGIPYHSIEPLTSFDEAQDIVNQLQQKGIPDIKVRYSGWFNGGLNHKVPAKMKVDGAIGGEKGLKQFAYFAKEKNVPVYPDVALLTSYSTSGFSKSKDAARTLRGTPATLYPFDLALNRRSSTSAPSYVISPRLVNGYVDSMLQELKTLKVSGVSLRDLAGQLDSDYRKNEQIDRTEAEAASVEALSRMYQEGLDMVGDGGNAYALPYLTHITNAPLTYSRFKIEDEGIPFYPLVIRGSIGYAGTPYNLSSSTNARQYILQCLEYGSHISFEWIYKPNEVMKDTDYSQLYAVYYGQWMDQATGMYQEVNEVLKKVIGQPIMSHQRLAEGVYKTVYRNNIYVMVNYNSSPVTVDGKTVGAESYITGGEEK